MMLNGMREVPARIDPAAVPVRTLASGARMPAIGLGTFGSDHVSAEQVAEAVRAAAEIGYRHFDCAAVYGNEHAVGEQFERMWKEIAPRESFWVTSKLWNDKHAATDVPASCRQSLRDLRLDYLDSYLVHWPFATFTRRGAM